MCSVVNLNSAPLLQIVNIRDVKASRPVWPRGQIIRPRPRSIWPQPHGIWPRPCRYWPRGLEHDIN